MAEFWNPAGYPLSVAVVVILGHPPEVDLLNGVADDVECVLGNRSRTDELVLFEGPSSWEVVVDHLAHLGAETFLIEICALCCAPARTQLRLYPILDGVPTGGSDPCRSRGELTGSVLDARSPSQQLLGQLRVAGRRQALDVVIEVVPCPCGLRPRRSHHRNRR